MKAWQALPSIRNWDDVKADKHLLANPDAFGKVLKDVISMLNRGEGSAHLVSKPALHVFRG